jgi:cell division protein FtsB
MTDVSPSNVGIVSSEEMAHRNAVSQELALLRQRQRNQTALWVTCVFLLVLALVGVAVWHGIEIRDLRNQERKDVTAIREEIQAMQAKWLSKQEESNDKLSKRYDTLDTRVTDFESDLSWSRGKLEAFQETLGANLTPPTGK